MVTVPPDWPVEIEFDPALIVIAPPIPDVPDPTVIETAPPRA